MPSVYAYDGIPGDIVCDADVDVDGGNVNRLLATERSMKRGDVGSTSWSAKSVGGEKGVTRRGET